MRCSMWVGLASAVLAGLGGAFLGAQEPAGGKPAPPEGKPAAPPVQEKIPLPAFVDSWYRVLQGDRYVGHLNERLQPGMPTPIRYEYTVLEEYELTVPDPQDPELSMQSLHSCKVSAKLDDTFAPLDMSVRRVRGNQEILGTVLQTETGRRLEIRLGDAPSRPFPVPGGVDLYYSPRLMFFYMRQNDLLSRTGQQNAKIFFPRSEETPVVDVAFEVKDWVQREYLGKKAWVTRVEWIKPVPAASREFEIVETYVDRYGRVVEEVARDGGLRFVIASGEEEAVGKSPHLRLAGREDPFRKDRALSVKAAEKAGREVRAEVKLPSDPAQLLASAEKVIEDLGKAKERQEAAAARELYQKGIQIYLHLREITQKDQSLETRNKVDEVKRRLEGLYGGARESLGRGLKLKEEALRQFDRVDLAGMERSLEALRKMEGLPEFVGYEDASQLKKWILDVEQLVGRCRTRLELARKRLEVTGVTLCFDERPQGLEPPLSVFGHAVGAGHELRFIRASHFAIINGQVCKVGDTVRGEGVRVEAIRKYSVQVSLGEEVREVGIRQ